MVDNGLIARLVQKVNTADVEEQLAAVQHIRCRRWCAVPQLWHWAGLKLAIHTDRDLSLSRPECRKDFGNAEGLVAALVGLLDSPQKAVTAAAAEALRCLAEEDALRETIRSGKLRLTCVHLPSLSWLLNSSLDYG